MLQSYFTPDSRALDTTEGRRSTFSIFLGCLSVSMSLSSLCVLWVREHTNMATYSHAQSYLFTICSLSFEFDVTETSTSSKKDMSEDRLAHLTVALVGAGSS